MPEFVVYVQIDATGSAVRFRSDFLHQVGPRQQNLQLTGNTPRLRPGILAICEDISDRVHKTVNSRCHFHIPVFKLLAPIIGSRRLASNC